ncbi:Glycosyl transferase, group 1 [Desulfurella amilsii]|uniref:Glycosyl transferase, group 1 n=1 Tax=Desulfurella amilsii TaxID=1562698 RepID=A0A1X4XXA3_9BACT|nr:glycosyltransferase [Desulfurella amilsii]OSS42172.1 Glycosyl transferase, group 1 [Desulfurella amilsii]
MNILQIEPAFSLSGGANQVVLNTKELIKRGHKVYLATLKDSYVYRQLGSYCEIIEIDEDNSLAAKTIRNFLQKEYIDIIHTHHPKGHAVGLKSVSFIKKEKLVVQRGVIFTPQNFFKYLNPKIDAYVANAKAVERSLRKIFVSKKKIHVIYSAIDEESLEAVDKKTARDYLGLDGFVFGVIANYSSYKGHDLLLCAFALSKLEAKLALIGKDTHSLLDKCKKFGISDKVKTYGLVENAGRFMSAFDYLVVPSLKEALSNVIIEAFFRKIPVIGTSIGAIPELLENNRGILAQPTKEGLLKALNKAYMSKDNSFVDNAYQFAINNLTIVKKIDKLEKLYERLISK